MINSKGIEVKRGARVRVVHFSHYGKRSYRTEAIGVVLSVRYQAHLMYMGARVQVGNDVQKHDINDVVELLPPNTGTDA